MKKETDVDKIIDKYADMINTILYNKLENIEDCEDIVQEIFMEYVKYIKKGKRFNTEEHEKCWLIRIALNLVSNKLKYNKIRKTEPLTGNLGYNSEVTCDNRLKVAINKLEKKYREIFELFYIHELKISEISKILKISESNAKTRLKRARDKVKEIILKGERANGRI